MAQIRKEPLVNGEYYHIFSRSIAKFVVFNDDKDYQRMHQLISLCRHTKFDHKYSQFHRMIESSQNEIISILKNQDNYLVEIVAYCIMPTHIHFILKQKGDCGISKFISRILNGYSRYFNTKHKRTGPLWAGRFKSVLVYHDDQLLHLTRYIHLNPTSANLVDDLIDWQYSSYKEYISDDVDNGLCNFKNIVDMSNTQYKKFVNDQKNYQKELSLIKYLTIDNYSG